ncbi:unnamed protein product [Zymoseptoria tritici ST99CH_3D1]|uniref:Cupin type-1 domain-containing protein n=2 Tax=Zymoseptoria tritici TaxID=1047171 RepID=A0A1X7RW39_ZYMT9|nr:unnamed protein product [Zymoseptoria tritici ST99CH_3D7]SMR53846.1 unnamed protein product [Zymoseptoria tritici ST99CH_1E4]SMR56105.1 unnamed protein product [Zymoseptoria tritici ST99CH_3D1]
MSIARFIVAGLASIASVSALPQGAAPFSSVSGNSTLSLGSPPSLTQGPRPEGPGSFSSRPVNTILPTISQPGPAAPVNSGAAAAAASAAAALAKEAQADVTNVARFNTLLTVNGDGKELLPANELRDRVVFDFGARAAPLGKGGRFVLANENNFPILVEQGISTAVAFLEPCSMNSPHTHPRATEWLTVVQGQVKTGFMLENGFLAGKETGQLTTQVSAELSAFQGTIFPQGSIHFQFNDQCEPATFIATLNSADPGTSQVAQNFFFLDDRVVDVALGEINQINGKNIDQFRTTLPANLVQAVDSCLARCGPKY